jgi:hypothetical protein
MPRTISLAMFTLTSCIAPAEFTYKGATDGGKDVVDGRMADGRSTLDVPETHAKDLPRMDLPDVSDIPGGGGDATDTLAAGPEIVCLPQCDGKECGNDGCGASFALLASHVTASSV